MGGVVENEEVTALLDELTRMPGRDDPYPRYDRLREIAPVARAQDGALVVTGYADCTTVVRDDRLGLPGLAQLSAAMPGLADHPSTRLLFTGNLFANPPDHTRLRRLVSASFTARRVRSLRPAVESMVDDLLAGLAGGGDFVGALAFPLPVNVIGELLGIPEPDRAQFQHLVRDLTGVLEIITEEVLRRADPAAVTIREYLAALAERRRREPGDDLLSALVAAEEAGEQLTEDELLNTAALLFTAGFETTTNLLANALVVLLRHPEALARLREHPELAEPAVEELLRFDSPVQLTGRTAFAPVEIGGVSVEPGTRVIAYLGAGNRDPRRFPEPNELRLDREDNAPLSFGAGIHYCLGAPLARLEAQVALPRLLRRFPSLALAGEPERRDSLGIRGFTKVPVTT